MPLAIRWPGHIQAGKVAEGFASHVDLAPTFLQAAGLKPPASMSSGSSLLGAGNRDCVYTAMERHTWCRPDGGTYPMRALRTQDFLYIRNFQPDRWPTGGPEFISSNKTFHGDVDEGPTKTFMVAQKDKFARQYDLGFGKRPEEELYDLAKDEFQMNNVAANGKYADPKRKLWDRLRQYLQDTGDKRLAGEDPWQAYVYRQTIGFGAMFNRSLPQSVRDEAAGRGSHKPE
jgi:N-sulfoglucosamine sulfohydrolase